MGNAQPPGRPEFVARVGTFFVLVGIGLLIFFLISDAANEPKLDYFCWSAIFFIIGFAFQSRFKRPKGPPSGRFSILQKLKPKPKEEKKK